MIPADTADTINRRILAVAEDCITGFHARPFDEIAARCGLTVDTVLERLRAMTAAGTVRRIRQTLLSTNLADGALIAWRLPENRYDEAWEWLRDHDPFTGHIVIRRCDNPYAPGADYRLWTTLKVPIGCGTVESHCRLLSAHIGADSFVPLPVVGMFSLGVGHVRRAGLQPGIRTEQLPVMQRPSRPVLSAEERQVLHALKEQLAPEEIVPEPWRARAAAIGMPYGKFLQIAAALDAEKVIGRFAVFLDHTRRHSRHAGLGASGLFHWAVPRGMEERAGAECGSHVCMTHCYWRSGGEKTFGGAQIMGVVHATDPAGVAAHKAAIDAHLKSCGIPILHTAVFRSERAEIRPSEISPQVYEKFLSRFSSRSE